jgi:HlyD family secretion protein
MHFVAVSLCGLKNGYHKLKEYTAMKIMIPVLTLFFILMAVAYFLHASGSERQNETVSQVYVTLQRRDLSQSIIATGIIKPKVGAEVKVGAQVSGVVKSLFVKTGSKVKKHDLLAVIDPRSYQSQKDKMSALKDIAATELKYAELELHRQKVLFQQQSISQQQYESASQQVELAAARLKQSEAEYEYANLQLGYTSIVSPIQGVVASIATQEGETVAAGFVSPTFVTVIDLNQLELWAYVDETDIGRIRKGQQASFTVDTYPGEAFEGTVETIYPKPEIQNSVVNYVTVISIPVKQEKLLRPEMTATVQLFTQIKKDCPTLPKNSVQTDGDKLFVNVLVNGKLDKRTIQTGISDKKYIEVLSGITEKEKVAFNQQ